MQSAAGKAKVTKSPEAAMAYTVAGRIIESGIVHSG